MQVVENQVAPVDKSQHGLKSTPFPILPILIVLIVGSAISLLVSYIVVDNYPGTPFDRTTSAFLSLALLATAAKVAYDWHKSESATSRLRDMNPVHEEFKNWLIRVLMIAIFVVAAVILILFSLGLSRDLLIISAEIGVLMVTIAFIVLCSKYSATSLTVDVDQLVREFRASNESLMNVYQKAFDGLTVTFNDNTTKLLSKLDEQGLKQSTILGELATVMKDVADALTEQKALQEETKRIAEEALEDQKRTAEGKAELERERERQRIEREEQDRLMIMPKLGLRMYSTGIVFHKVHLEVVNAGMSGENLEVVVRGDNVAPNRRRFGIIVGQGRKPWELGDVKGFPHQTRFQISAIVSDSKGRRYQFDATFGYERTVGWFDVTQLVTISPEQFLWPEPVLVENNVTSHT